MAQIEENSQQKYTDWWNDLMMRTGRKMTKTFEDNNVSFTDAIILTGGTRGMMKWIYHHLVKRKKVTPIEDLDIDSKKEMWNFIREVCLGKTNDLVIMKEVAIAFYALEYFINENN
jgi:hypothetical protein